jgi:hypothetical protein
MRHPFRQVRCKGKLTSTSFNHQRQVQQAKTERNYRSKETNRQNGPRIRQHINQQVIATEMEHECAEKNYSRPKRENENETVDTDNINVKRTHHCAVFLVHPPIIEEPNEGEGDQAALIKEHKSIDRSDALPL